MNDFKLPGSDQHVSIIGRTGSGKTQQGAWLLSESDFHIRPHIIVDYKGDELLNAAGATPLSINEPPPSSPGLYITHIMPGQDDIVDNFLWKIWAQNNTCVYIDESYMIDKYSTAYNALLTQGRSKNINLYNLTQRPTQCSRFCFSEASHVSVFHLIDERDRKTAESFIPLNLDEKLPEYHSHWYDVKNDNTFLMRPVPKGDIILSTFRSRIAELEQKKTPKRRFL